MNKKLFAKIGISIATGLLLFVGGFCLLQNNGNLNQDFKSEETQTNNSEEVEAFTPEIPELAQNTKNDFNHSASPNTQTVSNQNTAIAEESFSVRDGLEINTPPLLCNEEPAWDEDTDGHVYWKIADGTLTIAKDKEGEEGWTQNTLITEGEAEGAPGWFYKFLPVQTINIDESMADLEITNTASWFSTLAPKQGKSHGIPHYGTLIGLQYLNFASIKDARCMFAGGGYTYHRGQLNVLNKVDKLELPEATNISAMFASTNPAYYFEDYALTNSNKLTSCSCLFQSGFGSTDISKMNLSSIADASFMFCNRSDLTSITFPTENPLNLENITSINAIFCGCSGITELDISSWHNNPTASSNVSNAFAGCKALTKIITTSGASWESAGTGLYVFNGCTTQLKGGIGTPYDASKTTKDYAKADDGNGYFTAKTMITVIADSAAGDGVTIDDQTEPLPITQGKISVNKDNPNKLNIKRYGIDGSVIESVLSNTATRNVSYWEYENSTTNAKVKVPYDTEIILTSDTTVTCVFGDAAAKMVLFKSTPSTDDVTTMKSFLVDISNVQAGDLVLFCDTCPVSTWNSLSCVNQAYTYNNGYRYADVIPQWITENNDNIKNGYFDVRCKNFTGITSVGCMYYTCKNLCSIDGTNLNTSKVTDFSGFACAYKPSSPIIDATSQLKVKGLSDWDMSSAITLQSMFANAGTKEGFSICDISKWNTSNVTNMGWLFNGTGRKSTSPNIELDISGWDTSKVTQMRFIFGDMPTLTRIYVGEGWNTSLLSTQSTENQYGLFANDNELVGEGYGLNPQNTIENTGYTVNKNELEHAKIAFSEITSYTVDTSGSSRAISAEGSHNNKGLLTSIYLKYQDRVASYAAEHASEAPANGKYKIYLYDTKLMLNVRGGTNENNGQVYSYSEDNLNYFQIEDGNTNYKKFACLRASSTQYLTTYRRTQNKYGDLTCQYQFSNQPSTRFDWMIVNDGESYRICSSYDPLVVLTKGKVPSGGTDTDIYTAPLIHSNNQKFTFTRVS